MSTAPEELKYTKEHEWLRIEGDEVVVGITDFAAGQLGDVVFVELPRAGSTVTANQPFGVVESVKSVSDLYAPVSGEVTAVNTVLSGSPELVNNAAYGEGWMIRIRPSNPSDLDNLLSAADYRKLIA